MTGQPIAAERLERLPKAELHCHVEGTASPGLVRELARRHGADVAGIIAEDGTYRWSGFDGFLQAYDVAASVFRTPDDYRRLAREYLRGLAAVNTIYAEVFVSPDHALASDLWPEDYVAAIGEAMAAAEREDGIVSRMIVTGVRHFGTASVEAAARFASTCDHPLVAGFGLAGDERVGRPADFARAFDSAREAGLGLTAHAGEFAGADAVTETLDALKVGRIGHGVRAVEDAKLLARLAEEAVTLEVCPRSNVALGVVDAASHPLAHLRDTGCRVTLNSDDPPFFATSLLEEYRFAAEHQDFREADLVAVTRNAIEAAFVDPQLRGRLLERLTVAALSLGAPGSGG